MALLRLPLELLQDIIAFTRPEGFENALLTSRILYEVGQPLIKYHNDLKRRYSKFRYASMSEDLKADPDHRQLNQDHIYSPLQLLHEIGRDPLVAKYIKSADLSNRTYLYRGVVYEDDNPTSALCRDVNASKNVLKLLEQSSLMQELGLDINLWHREILEEEGALVRHDVSTFLDLGTTLVLTMLPNVECLSLPPGWGDLDSHCESRNSGYRRIISAIVNENRCTNGHGSSLGRLKELHPSVPTGYDEQIRLQPIAPFLGLPSLKNVFLSSGTAMPWGIRERQFDAVYDDLGATIERMELVGCVMGAAECSELFRAMASLKTLRFHYETKWHGLGHDWEAGDFIASLMSAVGDTLEILSLTIINCYGSISPILTMKGFQRLKDLELDIRLFLGPPFEEYTGGRNQTTDNYPRHVPKLIHVLPKSLETLRLLTTTSKEYQQCLGQLFADLSSAKDDILPHLREIIIQRGVQLRGATRKRPALPKPVRTAMDKCYIRVIEVDGLPQSEALSAFFERFPVSRGQ